MQEAGQEVAVRPSENPGKQQLFSVIKIEGGICQLLSSDYRIVEMPCKYMPFKALRVGETVRIGFRLKQEQLVRNMTRFQKHILDSI